MVSESKAALRLINKLDYPGALYGCHQHVRLFQRPEKWNPVTDDESDTCTHTMVYTHSLLDSIRFAGVEGVWGRVVA